VFSLRSRATKFSQLQRDFRHPAEKNGDAEPREQPENRSGRGRSETHPGGEENAEDETAEESPGVSRVVDEPTPQRPEDRDHDGGLDQASAEIAGQLFGKFHRDHEQKPEASENP